MHKRYLPSACNTGHHAARGWGRVTAGGALREAWGGSRAGPWVGRELVKRQLFGDNQALHLTVTAMPKNEG